MVSESRMTWATSVPILVLLGVSVLELGLMYATDRHTSDDRRQTYVRQKYCLMPSPYGGGGIIIPGRPFINTIRYNFDIKEFPQHVFLIYTIYSMPMRLVDFRCSLWRVKVV